MANNCWFCEAAISWEMAELIKNCPNCGCENNQDSKDTQPMEVKLIPDKVRESQFSPFLKLPNLVSGTEGDIKKGDSVEVVVEFDAPTNPKLKSPLIGKVKLMNGEEKTLGLNWTSYYEICKVYGQDTKDWVGKEITYGGMKTMGRGAAGHSWIVKK